MNAESVHVDLAFAKLHAAGWSIGDVGGDCRCVVVGYVGENQLLATGTTQADAWQRALYDAELQGMAGRSFV